MLTFVPCGLLNAKLNCYGMLQSVRERQIGNTLKQNRNAWGLLSLLGWLPYISPRGRLDAVLRATDGPRPSAWEHLYRPGLCC